jgi:phenylacetate-CoA ligase
MGRFEDFLTQNRLKLWMVDNTSSYRRDISSLYREMLRLEGSSIDEIAAYQQAKLRLLLTSAATTPYYQGVLSDLAINPKQFRLSDLSTLPFLTKDIIQRREGDLLVAGATGRYENYSGGSTGVPIRFHQDYRYRVAMSAVTRRSNELAGAFPGARVAKLWGAPQDRRQIEGWRGKGRLWLLNMRYFDSFDMSPERMESYHRTMEKFQPDLIQGYASSAYLMARYLRERGIRPSYPRKSIITAAEKLLPHMRTEIEEVFGVPVFDRYGSREISAMAAECGCHSGMHIQMPGYIVETIDAATGQAVEEQPGEIAVTVLNNFAMPFIRYRIGDLGVLTRDRCECGNSYYRLREIVGRTSDNFLLPDGRIVHGEYFTHIFYGRDEIKQFQFVQETREKYTLRLVPGKGYHEGIAAEVEREIRRMIGGFSVLEIELRDEIPKTSSGKFRFTVSNIPVAELVGARTGSP